MVFSPTMNVDVLQASIHLRDTGPRDAPVLLFLHGNPDSADLWDALIPLLDDRFRCIAPDLPGFGRSEVPPGFDFSLEAMASFVAGLMEALAIEGQIGLVVHDFGGPYGLAWAVRHPKEVSRVVMINSFFSSRMRWHFWARVWRTPFVGELSMRLMNRLIFAWELRRGSRRLPAGHVARAWRFVTPATKRTVLALYRATDPENFRGEEEQLLELARRVPVRVVSGRHDPYLDAELTRPFASDGFELLDGVGHWAPVEAPEEVARYLLEGESSEE